MKYYYTQILELDKKINLLIPIYLKHNYYYIQFVFSIIGMMSAIVTLGIITNNNYSIPQLEIVTTGLLFTTILFILWFIKLSLKDLYDSYTNSS